MSSAHPLHGQQHLAERTCGVEEWLAVSLYESPGTASTASYVSSPQPLSSSSRSSSNSGDDHAQHPAAGPPKRKQGIGKLRETNTLAARRSRRKFSSIAESLKNEVDHNIKEHERLATMAAELQEEVYFLRCQMRRHIDCECTLIRTYLSYTDRVSSRKRI